MSDNIKVVVKVRPLISREVEEKLSYRWRVRNNTLHHLDQYGKETDICFTFDKVYDKETKTREVYDDVAKPIVEAAVHGFNGTIFAYGQTSSGKTYTMTGTEEAPGIIPLAVLHLFEKIKTIPDRDFLVRVSYIEIYNETLKDLLNVEEKKNIKIHETLQGVKVDVMERVTGSPEEVLEAMREGEVNRQTGATNMNEESSRSHSIFQITIESREHIEGEEEVGSVNVSQLNLVDLAGSERAGQTGASGIRFKEGTYINKSLSVLALVIKQLSEANKYANYRDSKLTRILQNSLGGNAKTSIICAITPASVEETVSTLQFANRAKAIKNKPEVNAVATDATMIQSLTKQLSRLQAELVAKSNLEVMLKSQKNVEQELQKKIEDLQKLILNGFGQRSSMDIVGARRKPQPLRRVTISTLHHIEEEPVPQVPKFCTPSLKYNPLSLSTEFVPIQNPGKLASVPEEARMTTPPPRDKKVNINDEIIEIDSDDDTAADTQPCSPYHNCYRSSETPPCILRKNAKQAEKNLKDIVELTKREKIYTPTVVELLEKLEQNTNVITQLEEEISSLTADGNSKESKIKELNARIKKTEDEVKSITSAKLELESKCKEYDTQITDWEVSYETLRNKTKSREQELLSLLEERKTMKKNEEIGKLATMAEKDVSNFMDMSKDISLVNSDNESSLTHTNDDDAPSQVQELVTDIQSQLATKNQTILELEANLFTQRQKIESLETSSQQLQVTIDDFKNKLAIVETENSFLKSTIDSLNETVESQKRHLESADKDIQSYNSTIQELQINLTKKDNILNMKINDSVLENMVASEEKFIANNDNIKNIIHSFKIALENRNKEITNLKSTMQTNLELSSDNATLKEELEVKEKQIITLIEEAEKFKEQLSDNITVINNLMKLETDLTSQLSTIQEQYNSLNKINEENDVQIDSLRKRNCENEIHIQNLKTNCDELTQTVKEKEANEQNMISENQQLSRQIENMCQKISELEKDLNEKNILITAAIKTDSDNQDYAIRGKEIINLLNEMLSSLGSSIDSLPQTVTNVETVFIMLDEKINNLQTLLVHVLEEKNRASEALCESKEKLSLMSDTHKSEITQLEEQVETLTNEIMKQSEELSQQITQLTEEVNKLRSELENKNRDTLDLEIKLNDAKENNKNLHNDLASKENKISSLQENLSLLYSQLETLSRDNDSEIKAWQKNKESFEQLVQEKDTQIAALEDKISSITATLKEKYTDVNAALKESIDNRDKLMLEILKKASKLTHDYYDENDDEIYRDNSYEQIILTLDNVAMHITNLKTENDVERNDITELLSVARKQVEELTHRNVKLIGDCDELSAKNQQLMVEVERITNLNKELLGSSQLLNQLNMELQLKSSEIEAMQCKVLEWKDHFKNYDCVMKQQSEHFVAQNDKLKDIQNREKTHQYALSDVRESSSFETCQSFDENDLKSPQTLLTICCNRIIDSIQRNDNLELLTPSTSKSSIELQNAESQTDTCAYIRLTLELSKTKGENRKLIEELEKLTEENNNLVKAFRELESSQKYLLQEREDVRKEIQLLLEPAQELQKKISNHKTNLSTLTATTYAENKLLNSQLKVLKHYHTRYIHVCQRDLPAFKTQLNELMTILKGSLLTDKQNTSFKRYSLPDILDNNTTMSTFKNESILDGDLLMLDANMTLTTSADNTLVGHDQTCLDVTQINFDAEVACQTNELSKVMDPCVVLSQMETLSSDNQKLYEQNQALTQENITLKEEIQKLSLPSTCYKDAQSSPIKMNSMDTLHESFCKNCNDLRLMEEKLTKTVKELSQELQDITGRKEIIEQKYNNLTLEIPSSDALVKKLGNTEKELKTKIQENEKLCSDLNKKSSTIRELQEENDSLSVQVMDNISEADNLKKELDNLKDENSKLLHEYEKLKHLTNEIDSKVNGACPQCEVKEELIKQLQSKQTEHSKLNRSLSDSDSSSRHNKICTLQNELHASKEDCKKITEEVVTLKNQLERSNISIGQAMDLDESMGDSNIFTFTKDFDTTETAKFRCSVPEERPSDVYTSDKIECFNYYVEMTDAGKENLDSDVKIIDLMKLFYNKLITKHGNEVENLLNKLRDYEELKCKLQSQVNSANDKYAKVTIELEKSQENVALLRNVLSKIRYNISTINQEMSNVVDADKNTKLVTLFKENLLRTLDFEFGLTSVNIFESLIDNIYNKHQKDLSAIMEQYTQLQSHMENVVAEFNTLNENIKVMKSQLSNKESEYNLLKAQKERLFEISNAVTLDMVQKEKELTKILADGCTKLAKLDIISPCDIDETPSLDEKIKLLFESLINGTNKIVEIQNTIQYLTLEVDNLKVTVEEKEKMASELNNRILEIEGNLQTQTALHEDLTKIYENKIEENKTNVHTISILTKEIEILKHEVNEKENLIYSLENQATHHKDDAIFSKDADWKELLEKLESLKQDYDNMKSINELITKERDTHAAELEKAQEIIRKNKIEMDKMTSDILVLRESVNDNVCIIETLTLEAKSLMEQNIQLKQQFKDKTHDCARLEINIKTHEKTAEIQSKMIMRLQKQKEEDDKSAAERDKRLKELTEKYDALQKECEMMKNDLKAAREDVERLKNIKESLDTRVSELEASLDGSSRRRLSDAAESARRRRQSLHDSKRTFAVDKLDNDDHNKIEAVFGSRAKPDDLFMDVDEEQYSSNRSTPVRLSRGRDSFVGRQDHSDKDEESSRPNSVTMTRRRRQSTHDLHRSLLRHTPSPSGRASIGLIEEGGTKPTDSSNSNSEVSQLREQLASCQQELEELKDQYRELDEECETCAQYLREREEQCRALKKEKTALEIQVAELNEKLKSGVNHNQSEAKSNYANASVNTDEDWANLHSVVVDRMSFDAEVEKNKKLIRTIEELRCNKQELKNTVAKMQRALEKNAGYRESKELEATKAELTSCRQQLAELQERYRELDEECETCGQYLREREEQCRKLRESKHALEAKLQELQEETGGAHAAAARRKRQSLHDQNRRDTRADASTDTSDDLLSYQVERDESSLKANNAHAQELKRVKTALDKVLREKAALENQLLAAMPNINPTMFVATGSAIVQNQQITDVMKENQKLKKINAKLITICKKRGKSHDANRENEEPSDLG